MKRRPYRPAELRAGHTFFVAWLDMMTLTPRPVVQEYLVTSRAAGHWPAEGEWYPYRLRPELVEHIAKHCPLYRTRRAAKRAALAELDQFNRKQKARP